jgi:hypothetical protein
LIKHEHGDQYRIISEHGLCGEFEQLLMDVFSQETSVIELNGDIFFNKENG